MFFGGFWSVRAAMLSGVSALPVLAGGNMHSLGRVGTFLAAASREQHLSLISTQRAQTFDDCCARFFRHGRGRRIGPSGCGPLVATRTGLEMSFLAEALGGLFSPRFLPFFPSFFLPSCGLATLRFAPQRQVAKAAFLVPKLVSLAPKADVRDQNHPAHPNAAGCS